MGQRCRFHCHVVLICLQRRGSWRSVCAEGLSEWDVYRVNVDKLHVFRDGVCVCVGYFSRFFGVYKNCPRCSRQVKNTWRFLLQKHHSKLAFCYLAVTSGLHGSPVFEMLHNLLNMHFGLIRLSVIGQVCKRALRWAIVLVEIAPGVWTLLIYNMLGGWVNAVGLFHIFPECIASKPLFLKS